MASVDEIKLGRSKAKTAVTTAARRLHGASHRRSDKDVLKDLMLELERAFGDFCSISEEYEAVVMESGLEAHRKVNGEDLHTYRESVTQTYDVAKDAFLLSLLGALPWNPGTHITICNYVSCRAELANSA